MGEETKQEQAKEEEANKPEAKAKAAAAAAAAEEEEEEKKEGPPQPPSPCVLSVDLHCVGCAKNIQKSILKIKGVEGVVEFEMSRNEVTVKGVIEQPQAICAKITKKTKRRAQVLSPISPPALGAVVKSQVTGLTTVELNVNMHCKACAEQLKTKILKMRGVRSATTVLGSGKVTVTGTMEANKLVDYVYRRTKKEAEIAPQPEPQEEEEKPAGEKRKPEEKKEEQGGEKPPDEEKKEGDQRNENDNTSKEETKELEPKKKGEEENILVADEQTAQRMMYYYQPLDVMERIPPAPQLFSDENPNACCAHYLIS